MKIQLFLKNNQLPKFDGDWLCKEAVSALFGMSPGIWFGPGPPGILGPGGNCIGPGMAPWGIPIPP